MFTQEELNNLTVFMARVEIRGSESLTHALLLQKLQSMLQTKPEPKEDKPAKT